MIPANQEASDGMFFLGMNGAYYEGIGPTAEPCRTEMELPAPREQHTQCRRQGDRQDRCDDHSKGLGISQWPEQATFLRFQSEHRKK